MKKSDLISEDSATFYPKPLEGSDMAIAKQIRTLGRLMASYIEKNVPESADRTLAVRHLEDAVMRSVKAIAQKREQ